MPSNSPPFLSTQSSDNKDADEVSGKGDKGVIHALTDPSWIEAMQEELLQFKLQKFWTLMDLLNGNKAIGTKWVFRNKKDKRGVIVRNNARLVAQGLQVEQKDNEIFISQDKYVADILKKFDFTTVKTASTLMDPNKALIKDAEAKDVDVNLYRLMIGSLMYLIASRLDIMFAVCARVRDSPSELEAFSDSDYARASLDRKSTIGVCQFLSKRQLLWIQNQMLDYGFNFMNTMIYIDNEKFKLVVEQRLVLNGCLDWIVTAAKYEIQVSDSGLTYYWLQNAEDTACLPNDTIFEELARMGAKTTTWNEFSSTMASAIICLATIQKFNFSKYILDNMREGKSYSGIITLLFKTMMVQAPIELGEGSEVPTETHHTPIVTQPSSSQPQKKQKSRRKQTKEAKLPHIEPQTEESVPTHSNDPLSSEKAKSAQVKEIVDLKKRVKKLERKKKLRTSCLKRLYKVGLSARIISSDEEGLGDQEDVSKHGRIAKIDADEDLSLINETTHDQRRMNDQDLFGVNDLDGDEVIVDVTNGVNVEQDATVVEKEVSTATDEVVTTTKDVEVTSAATTPQISKDDVILVQTLIEIKAAKPRARGVIVQEPSEFRTTSSSQPSQLLHAKDKGKRIIVEPEKPLKNKDQITLDEEVPRKLEAQMKDEIEKEERIAKEKDEANIAREQLSIEERSKLLAELIESGRKYFSTKRAKEIRNKPPTKARQKSLMCTYMKNMEGYKQKDFKGKSFNVINKMFDKVYKRVNTFVDMNIEILEESLKKTQAEVTEGSSKRARDEIEQESAKRQRIDKEDDIAELKRCLEIVPKDDDVTIEATPLSFKSPVIVDYKIYKEGKKSYFRIIRADGNSQNYLTFRKMFKNFNREDFEKVNIKFRGGLLRLKDFIELLMLRRKLDRKNEMKARGTLLMALLNKDQLKFHSYKEAKFLMEVIEKRYGGNMESKKVQRTLLKQQYENFAASRSGTSDQTFNSANSTSSINEADNTAYAVSTTHSQGNIVNSTSVDNHGDAVICAFLASQPNSPQLAREDLEQIDLDDLEEMDLYLEMAILTIRARRAPKNQENKGREYGRKTVPVENPTKNALIAQDRITGYDWSYQDEEEYPTNYALMALTSSGSSSSSDSAGNLWQSEMLVVLINQRKKLFAQQRAEAKRNKPMTQAQQRTYMSNYIKHIESYTLKQLKKLSFEKIKELFEATMRRIQDFVPMKRKGDKEVSKFAGAGGSKRDTEEELDQGTPEQGMNVEALQVKYPIIDWEIYSEESRKYWKIIKIRNHTEVYQFFDDKLKVFNMDDLVQLWSLVKDRFSSSEPNDDKDKELKIYSLGSTVRVFPDPILFWAGLKPSWEYGQQRPAIMEGDKEMAFKNFIYTKDDEDLLFLPKEPSSGFKTGSLSISVNMEPLKADEELVIQPTKVTIDSKESPQPKLFVVHPRSVATRIKDRKYTSTSHATRAKTSSLKDDVPYLTVSNDDEGLLNVLELKDDNACHLKISAITPPAWKNHLDNHMDVELLDLHDRCYVRQDVVDNAINKRSHKLLQVIEKLRGEFDVMKDIERAKEEEYEELHDKCKAAMTEFEKNPTVPCCHACVSTILYGRCRAYEQVADIKEPFDLSKVKGYRSSYKKDHTQASNDLATATFPWLDEFVADPLAPIEALLSKKPPSIQRPAPSRT
nr:hypothetical protein [Tanacetum cinerariifolium]